MPKKVLAENEFSIFSVGSREFLKLDFFSALVVGLVGLTIGLLTEFFGISEALTDEEKGETVELTTEAFCIRGALAAEFFGISVEACMFFLRYFLGTSPKIFAHSLTRIMPTKVDETVEIMHGSKNAVGEVEP